jgi:hypothetical protein
MVIPVPGRTAARPSRWRDPSPPSTPDSISDPLQNDETKRQYDEDQQALSAPFQKDETKHRHYEDQQTLSVHFQKEETKYQLEEDKRTTFPSLSLQFSVLGTL